MLDEECVCILILPIFKRTKEHQRRPSGSKIDYRDARRPKSVRMKQGLEPNSSTS